MEGFLPPSRHVKTPRAASPRGACDCHFHVFPAEGRDNLAPDRGFTPAIAPLDDWLACAGTLGLERGVLVQPSPYGTDNRVLLEAVARAPDRLRAVVALAPQTSVEQLHALNRAGARGVRVNHYLHQGRLRYAGGMTLESVRPLLPALLEIGWHVELWIDVASDLPDVMAQLRDWPPVPLVFDHMGCPKSAEDVDSPGFQQMLALVACGQAWVKLSGVDRIYPDPGEYPRARPVFDALLATRTDRLVWGTNWPHPHLKAHMPDDGDLLDLFNSWVPDAGARQAILAANPARLYDFAAPD